MHFPYMFWARSESFLSTTSLSQSGMAAADPAVLGDLPGLDLGHPGAVAQPALEAELAEIHGVAPERVLVTPGASGAMHLVAMRFFKGARVVTEVPSYEPFRSLPAFFGSPTTVVNRNLNCGLDLDAVESAVAESDGPLHVFISNPNNPTGSRLGAEELVQLAELAGKTGGILISNEIYMEFAPEHERVHAATLAPNALSISSLTKAYGLGALRTGWIVLGEELAKERSSLLDHSFLVYVDTPTCALQAARRAVERRAALLEPFRQLERESRPLLADWLETTEGVIGGLGPNGLSSFPCVEGVDDTHALQRFLAAEEDVDVVPGEFFGAPGHLRISFGLPPAELAPGLERLTRGIARYRTRV